MTIKYFINNLDYTLKIKNRGFVLDVYLARQKNPTFMLRSIGL